MDRRRKILEEVKKCSTREELDDLLIKNSISLPPEALENVTGGTMVDGGYTCQYCFAYFHGYWDGYWKYIFHCLDKHYFNEEADRGLT